MDSVSLTLFNQNWALWISFFFSLLLFSVLWGNHTLAKVAQYLLVGTSLGYLGVLLWQHVLVPRLVTPLSQAPFEQGPLWLAGLLGLVFWLAALERMWLCPAPQPVARWRQLLRQAGLIPVALMVGVSISAVMIGLLQGTLWPQFWYTARSGFVWSTALDESLISVLVLLLTTATLLHWTAPTAQLAANQPRWVQQLLALWSGVGKRALWFAAGVIFARLLAAHLSLLIGRLQFLLVTFQKSFLWQSAEQIWQLFGGR